MAEYKIVEHFLTKNDCYTTGKKRTSTKGVVKHSTGANNPELRRYIDDEENLGKNQYNNHWNQSGSDYQKCVHFFIGLDKNGEIAIYQTLPLDYRCWGCGKGSKGTYNDTHVQYEICEDALTDEDYFTKAFDAAAWLDKYICDYYGLSYDTVVSHKEACAQGYASNHGDPENWLTKFGKNMDWCRSLISGGESASNSASSSSTTTSSSAASSSSTASSTKSSTTSSTTSSSTKLTVDGSIGPKTTKRWQEVMGTTVDGKISGQDSSYKIYWASISSSVCDWSGGKSQLVTAVQKMIGTSQDGILGNKTAKGLQNYLIGKGYSCGSSASDGYFGSDSAKGLQNWLNAQ